MNQAVSTIDAKRSGTIDKLPRIECGIYPTPLEELTRLREELGPACPRIFIKRDDYTGTAFGSNKLRKLDYAIADELERGTNIIVTIAGECSNHARVTAAVCAKFGLECILVLNRAETHGLDPRLVPASRFAYEQFGAKVHWVDSREERKETALCIVDTLRGKGKRVAFLPLGVSFPLGAVGFVRAVSEIAEQFSAHDVFPSRIFHASTSGGTQAGLIVGCRSIGRADTKIVGVSPDDPAAEIRERVAQIANGLIEQFDTGVDKIAVDDVCVVDDFVGEGYGKPTEASAASQRLLGRCEAVILDHTYTAKAFAALLDEIETGRLGKSDTVLFWHTGGLLGGLYAPSNTVTH